MLSGMTTGTTAVALLTTSPAAGPVGFLTRPNAVSCHCHFQFGLVGTLTSVPDQVTELAPDAVALATVVPVAYVPAAPPVQPVKVVDRDSGAGDRPGGADGDGVRARVVAERARDVDRRRGGESRHRAGERRAEQEVGVARVDRGARVVRVQHRERVVDARLGQGRRLLTGIGAVRIARAGGRDEDDRRQRDRQHEHRDHRENERDALLFANEAAPRRDDAATVRVS